MTVSMTELMRRVRNYFVDGVAEGAWTVADGELTGAVPLPDGWVGLPGGAYELRGGRLAAPDMTIDGPVYLLRPPEDFLRLHAEINQWLAAQPAGSAGAAVTRRRESFGAYSTETAYSAPEGGGSWEAAFAERLTPYRRMFAEVSL